MQADQPSASFIDWWFAPWRNGGPALPAGCDTGLAQRDAYRHWCRQAAVQPQLPPQADWRWQAAAGVDAATLLQAADLFAGLLAARRQRHDDLAQLAPAQRRWCLAVALTQPLIEWCPASASLRQHGLVELALRLECALPGLWSRLALLLPPAARPQLHPGRPASAVLSERDRRCWMMCLAQAGSH